MMNRSKLVSRVVALCALSLPGILWAQTQQADRQTLTLDLKTAIGIALNENPTVKVADMEIEKKDYSKKETIAGLFPRIDGSASYSRTIEKQTMYMDSEAFDMSAMFAPIYNTIGQLHPEFQVPQLGGGSSSSGETGMKVGTDNTYSVGFSASLPIIAPQLWKSVQMSSADIEQAVEAARSSRLSLVNQVEKAYYSLLLAQNSYEVIKMSYDNAKLNAQDYKHKFEQGTASEYDVLRAEVQVRNLEPTMLQTENSVKLSKLQLKVLMGIDMTVEIALTDRLEDYEASMYEETLNIDTSLEQNTDLRQLDLQTAYLKKAVDVQRMSWFPTLSATANYNWISMSDGGMFNDFRWSPYSSIGLSLSLPIFQGGARHFRIKQAKSNVLQLGLQRENLKNTLSMQVQMSMDNIQKSVKQIASNKEGVRQAEKAYAIMQKSFEIGSATFIELNDADLALTNSRLSYNQAIYDFLAAKSDLQLLLGNTDLEQYRQAVENTK
ncbi:TolC family protein [Barnesiella viscericola]|uniref:TolC family protein n=1 Tax=Barnesiella viscericola TaxID=397865 RepID=UPI002357ECDD|nr:TolC family protein [Barnesiella viscericola]